MKAKSINLTLALKHDISYMILALTSGFQDIFVTYLYFVLFCVFIS